MTLVNPVNVFDNVAVMDDSKIEQISDANSIRYCRTCMIEIKNEYNVSHRVDTSYRFAIQTKELWEYDVKTMLLCLTSLKIEQDDGFSQEICSNCIQNIIFSFSFRLQCINADSELRKHSTNTTALTNYQDCSLDTSTNISDDSIREFLKVKQDDNKLCFLKTEDKAIESSLINVTDECFPDATDNNNFISTFQEPEDSHGISICLEQSQNVYSLEKDHFFQSTIENPDMEMNNVVQLSSVIKEEFVLPDYAQSQLQNIKKDEDAFDNTTYKKSIEVSSKNRNSSKSRKKKESSQENGSKNNNSDSTLKCVCYVCGKHFRYNEFLRKHIARHSNTKPFSCKICNKAFHLNDDLYKHMNRHSSNKFICNVCGATFSRKDSLRTHNNIHLGIKPHACPHCSKRFLNSYNLQNHIRIHSKESPYVCEICKRAFKQKTSLVRHTKIHNNK